MAGVTGTVETGTILDRIIATTAQTNDLKKSIIPVSGLARMAKRQPKAVSLRATLSAPDQLGLIAEIKRASPSKGKFSVDFEVADVAEEYLFAGANAISVLTDEPFFHGLLDDLQLTSEVASVWQPRPPVLRKDFIIDEYQLIESRAFGADATLLIVAALTDESLTNLVRAARRIGIEVLVEVHDETEMERALAAGARLIGINNRDLHTFQVDLSVSERLAGMVPDDVVLVGESGIASEADARRMRSAGMDAVLVGESLILASDREAAIRSMMIDEPRGARG